jgi:hypothetical protein
MPNLLFWLAIPAVIFVTIITSSDPNERAESTPSVQQKAIEAPAYVPAAAQVSRSARGISSDTDDEEHSIEISRDDAIDEHWDDIQDNVSGTETVNACSKESGNCYDLEADISDGHIETLHFNNGGYLGFYADIDSDGTASDSDRDGNWWDFELSMESNIIDDAIDEWANDNGYTVY